MNSGKKGSAWYILLAQYSSKIGSSRYGHTKFTSSHPYMILNIILQVRVLSYWLLWRLRTSRFSCWIYLNMSMLCFWFLFLIFLISVINGWCMGLSLILISKTRSLILWSPYLFLFKPFWKQWIVACLFTRLYLSFLLLDYIFLSSASMCLFLFPPLAFGLRRPRGHWVFHER